jgi:ATP-dependent Zn protease
MAIGKSKAKIYMERTTGVTFDDVAGIDEARAALLLDVPRSSEKEYSEDTARTVDSKVRTLLEAAHQRVRATLALHEPARRALAPLLIEKELVDRTMLASILGHAEATTARVRTGRGTARPSTDRPAGARA